MSVSLQILAASVSLGVPCAACFSLTACTAFFVSQGWELFWGRRFTVGTQRASAANIESVMNCAPACAHLLDLVPFYCFKNVRQAFPIRFLKVLESVLVEHSVYGTSIWKVANTAAWSATAAITVVFAFGISESTTSKRCFPLVGPCTSCRHPILSAASLRQFPSGDSPVEKWSQRCECTFTSPRIAVPRTVDL